MLRSPRKHGGISFVLETMVTEKEIECSILVSKIVVPEEEIEPLVPVSETFCLEAEILGQEDIGTLKVEPTYFGFRRGCEPCS